MFDSPLASSDKIDNKTEKLEKSTETEA